MKIRLKEIYQALSEGHITQKEALEEIRTLKEKSTGTLLSAPVWEENRISGSFDIRHSEFVKHHIILCDLPDVNVKAVENSVAAGECLSFQTSRQKNIAERFGEVAQACFEFIKKELEDKPSGKILIQVVISGTREEKVFAGLSGLLKTAALENPQITGQVIFTVPDISAEELAVRLQADAASPRDEVIKYENDTRSVLRLQEIHVQEETPRISFKDQGVYLITGGLGGLGVLFTKEIVEQTGRSKIILTGRSALTPEKKRILKTLSGGRASVGYMQVDVADPDQVRQLVVSIKKEHKQLNGILHCAGTSMDNFIIRKSSEEFRRVLLPKVTGAFNLDEATRDTDLDFMVLFSSIASWLGNSGQVDYAAANGFMDRYAVYRNSLVEMGKRKGKTLSVNWPLWEEGGMKIDGETRKMLKEATGLHTLQTAAGMLDFYRSLELKHSQVMVAAGNYTQMRRRLFENNTNYGEETLPVVKTVSNGAELTGLFEKTQDLLCKELASHLKIASHQLDVHAPLENYGIDSILAMSLTNQLGKTFGSLPKTLFFEYLTVHELTGYFTKSYPDTLKVLFTKESTRKDHSRSQKADATLSKSISQIQTGPIGRGRFIRRQQQEAGNRERPNINNEPIAIIGISGRYPESENIGKYWQNLRDGKDCITEVPKERWDWRKYYTEDRTQSGHYSKWGGFITGVDEFDPRFFNISPREASNIDPQERLFLQHTWMAVEDAGYTRSGLQLSEDQDLAGQVGVYAGVMYGEYQLFGAEGKQLPLMNSYASIANRVSYVFNLHGPSMTLDTMCSSSLTAIHVACQDLKLGRTRMAIAGGVNVSIHPNKYLYLSAGQFISGAGHCQSFGEGGDGYIPGEGVGVVLLKRLSEAERDGDHIYGVIKGSVLNHGGKTNGYSVPNPKAQASAIGRALSESKIDPRHISYIEAHGTGTRLGDPIEIAALDQAFKKYTGETGYCLLGSAKSNIGHCESAAGIAGLTKVLLQLQHREIVPSLHSEQLNPYIDFDKTPFKVNQTLRPWDRPVIDGRELPRIAGISSFGAGGSNAHLIIEEYERSAEVSGSTAVVVPDTTVIIPLSARTTEQLKQKATDLLDFIHTSQPDLIAMAYTLQAGREAMGERLGFIVSSIDQLTDKLEAYINGEDGIEDTYRGQVKQHKEALSMFGKDVDLQQTVDQWIARKKLSKLLELWVKGLELDWNKFYESNRPKLISLPTYPFAKERYWVDKTDTVYSESPAAASVLHPLLHVNTSDMLQQSYSSTFNGKEFFFADHWVNQDGGQGEKALPAVVYLEMARAAVEKAIPTEQEGSIVELHDVVWGQPFTVTENRQIKIALFAKDGNRVAFEIYSNDGEEEIIHCQGQAVLTGLPTLHKRNIGQLKEQMVKDRRATGELYSYFSEMGINYASAYQGVISVYQGEKEVLARLDIPSAAEAGKNDYQLHPTLMDSALQASFLIFNRPIVPFAVETMRVVSGCTGEMFALVRYSQEEGPADIITKLNIDLCDREGNICVEIRGLVCQGELSNLLPQTNISAQANSFPTHQQPERIDIPVEETKPGEVLSQTFSEVTLKKPSDISLDVPGDLLPEKFDRVSRKKTVLLSDVASGSSPTSKAPADARLSLYNYGNGIYSIQISAESKNTLSQGLITQLLQAFHRVQQEPLVKVLILGGTPDSFLRGGRKEYNEAIEQKLFHTIASFPYPLIAAMQGDATGAGFLVGALCDFMVCSREGNYCYTAPKEDMYPVTEEYRLFEERFGRVPATDFLNLSTPLTGQELKEKGWTCPILPREQVQEHVQNFASVLARKSEGSLSLLKQHLARHIMDLTRALIPVSPGRSITSLTERVQSENREENVLVTIREEIKDLSAQSVLEEESSELSAAAASSIPLNSNVISATAYPEGILLVQMKDRETKNMFSDAFTRGMTEVFEHIEQTEGYKVVILTGYDNYFASGGTKEALLAIQEGKTRFTDTKVYQLPLECKLPVIAAMQGHGIGAGWAMGMFADFILFSEESKYVSPYMNYGFTPGAGATFIFPEKIGYDLARETLFTAREYSGSEFRERGLPVPVMRRQQINEAAFALARQIARRSRSELIAFKDQLTHDLYKRLEEAIELELKMHGKTFVGRHDTLKQINNNFNGGNPDKPADIPDKTEPVPTLPDANSGDTDNLSEVTAIIRQLLAEELHLAAHEIDENTQFIDLGLDSITGVTWIRRINEKYKTSIEATKIYSYPTLSELSRYVKKEADELGTVSDKPESDQQPVPDKVIPDRTVTAAQFKKVFQQPLKKLTSRRNRPGSKQYITTSSHNPLQPIAVVGMAGEFPMSGNPEAFWQNIASGKNCINEVPSERWDIGAFYHEGEAVPGKTNSKWAGLMEGYDLFDPLFFNISPSDAESMDPQQRVLLQTCWESIENAGYDPKTLSGSKCGVYIGCAGGDYHLLSRELQISAQGFTGGATSILAARISYMLNLQGPCLSIDTACSSSLVAIATACDSLVSGSCDMAMAGGVYVMTGPEMHIKSSQAGMLSKDGKCYTFDNRANGFVPGEGVGVVILKRLADAQKDNDNIYGVIQGWGVNQDGKTNGITAPNEESQVRLEREVYDKFRIDPGSIQLIEAHGTGTRLGDPIEVNALKESFKKYTSKKAYCALGSVKSNIGHCLTAAGVAGFIKTLLALKHKQLPPTINCEGLNEHIGLENSPFYVNNQLQEWKVDSAEQRRAAISAFGFSGTNAHIVLSEYVAPVEDKRPVSAITQNSKIIVPLSAKTEDRLKQKAVDLLDFITKEASVDLLEMAYTLQAGREAMEERLAFMVRSREELVDKLRAYAAGKKDIQDTYLGQVKSNKEGLNIINRDEDLKRSIIETWINEKKLSKLADLWVKGVELDWNRLYGEVKPRRIALPTYPFAKERYWFDKTDPVAFHPSPDGSVSGRTEKLYGAGEGTHNREMPEAEEASRQLFFEEYWQDQPLPSNGSLPDSRQTIIFADEEFRKKMADGDDNVWLGQAVFVDQGKKYEKISERLYHCRFNNMTDILKTLGSVSDASGQPVSLIYTWAKGQKENGIHKLFNLFKAIKAFGRSVNVTLVGHYEPSSSDTCWDYSWIGFEQSLKLVLPDVQLSILYTDSSAYTPGQLLDAVKHPGVIWYKDQNRFTLSLRSSDLNNTVQEPVLRKNGSYLITGGCGELGFRFAHYLAKEYRAKLLLLGRSPLTPGIWEKLDQLKQAGAQEVNYEAVDISDRKALTSWAQKLPFDLSGIIHAAGVESTRVFHEKTAEDIDEVLQPKTTGTVLLDEVLYRQPLDFVCYFSSSAALLGDFGSCDYAIANRFQMAYARYCRQKGRDKFTVINWPFWKDGGMGKGDAERAGFYLKSSGQDALDTSEGLEIWHDIIRSGRAQTLVLKGKPPRVEQFLNRIYKAELQDESLTDIQNLPLHTGKGWKMRYQDLSLKECVFSDLIKLVSTSLKIPAEKLDGITNLADYGFDSISLAAFARRLKEHFGLNVTPALFFNYSTIGKLSDYFVQDHFTHIREFYSNPRSKKNDKKTIEIPGSPDKKTSLPKQSLHGISGNGAYTSGVNQEPIAVIGMSGRFPKADTVDQLWAMLEKGESGISEVPLSRWDWRDYFTAPGDPGNKINTNKGGFINNVDEFDPLFFEISPREAEATDPGQRLLLMEAYKAIEDARIDPSSLRGSPVGVFVGLEESQYDQLVVDEQGVGNSGNAMISSRLSYFLDLHGPTISLNTACSSGLVALHQAVTSLRNGECESALIAGISSLILSPTFYVKMSQAGMLSQDGQCYSFAKKANGIGAGEAVVVLMLKPLSAAIEAGNPIYGTIKASGINFDGKTNGVTAPNGRRQEELIKNIYTNYSIAPRDVSHIVAHGTGTKLGDPIELNALNEAFKKLNNGQAYQKRRCAITSCKSNLGHTMAASGLVSVVSLLKGLQHNKIPATINCEDENDYISWEDSPFYINKATTEWEKDPDKPRLGGVSSFGRSGTNAHVVIEEYVPQVAARTSAANSIDETGVIIALSAKAEEQLRQKAGDLLGFINTLDSDAEDVQLSRSIDLAALAYSLQVTREAMEVRLGFIVSSVEELGEKLRSYINDEEDMEGVYQGEVKRNDASISLFNADEDLQETIDKWIADKRLSKLLDLWVKGLDLDWNKLYGEDKPQRINIPKYPFARERCWIDKKAHKTAPDRVRGHDLMHNGNYEELIEDIINRVEDESIDISQAVKLLNNGSYTV